MTKKPSPRPRPVSEQVGPYSLHHSHPPGQPALPILLYADLPLLGAPVGADDVAEADSLNCDEREIERLEEVAIIRDEVHVHDTAEGDVDEEAYQDND